MTSGEAGVLILIGITFLAILRKCSLQTPPFFVGIIFGGWASLTFLVGHGGGAPAWLPGLGGGWGGIDPAPLFCSAPPKRSLTVLIPLPDVFEPMEVAVVWSTLTEQGHTIQFLTRDGKPSVPAAHRMHGIVSGQFMQDETSVLDQTRIMINEPSFRKPIPWDHHGATRVKSRLESVINRASGIIITGGLSPGVNDMIESESLRTNVVLPMWKAEKPFGTLSRGSLVLAQTVFPGTNTSILNDRKIATPRILNERMEHNLLSMFGIAGSVLDTGSKTDGNGGVVSSKKAKGQTTKTKTPTPTKSSKTNLGGTCTFDKRYTANRLVEVLKWPNQQLVWEPMFTMPWLNLHHSLDMRHARVVRDRMLLSAANRKDSQLFAHRYVSMLHGMSSSSSGTARHTTQQACHDEVVLCTPLKMGGYDKQLNFVVHRSDLYPGRLLSKVQTFVRKHGGVYRSSEAQANDVDVLYRSARISLEKIGEVQGYESAEESTEGIEKDSVPKVKVKK